MRRLQEELARYGYYEGDIDGVYGNQTRRAVEQFQYQHGLSADGMAGRVTLTVLYESNQVRMSPTAVTPRPLRHLRSERGPHRNARIRRARRGNRYAAAPPPRPAPRPASRRLPPTPSATPAAPTATPTPTAVPSATPAPSFEAMTGYGIRLDGAAGGRWPSRRRTRRKRRSSRTGWGEEVYLPLLEILHAAGINVIASESVEADEYAFAMNDDIIRIAFTHDQSGAPVGLEVYKNNEAQIVPVRDIRSVGDVLYLPAATIESLTGIAAQVDEAAQTVIVTLPAAPEEAQ